MLVVTKLNLGDKVYFIFGNPAQQLMILSATISQIKVFEKNKKLEIEYGYTKIRVEINKSVSKFPADLFTRIGYVSEKMIDDVNFEMNSLHGFSFSDWPTFTTKKLCKEYIRKKIEENKK